ncbi:MAG: ankyrin repeat domain-containing protein [Planctomycetaceae bacterium]|jgi:ankyrin repeat protein|nr:ankyrin repeat domain-containing protein [Planctomycetaceae bacterium]
MANWHYYNADGKKVGPVTGEQLKILALDGIISPRTIVETEEGKPRLAKDVEGLTFTESSTKPNRKPDSESAVKKKHAPIVKTSSPSSPSSTPWRASHVDWESIFGWSFLSVFALLILIGMIVMGMSWYGAISPSPHLAAQQVQQVVGERVGQQPQNIGANVVGASVERPPQPSSFKDIFEASTRGSVDDVRYFIDTGKNVDVNRANPNGETPLFLAVAYNPNIEVVRYLVSVRGVDVNARGNDGKTLLDVANTEEKRVFLREKGVVEKRAFLRTAGASVYQSPFVDIFEAARMGTVQDVDFFVKKGADVNARNDDGHIPLHLASVQNSNIEVLRCLVSLGADVNAKNRWGSTPLFEAVAHLDGAHHPYVKVNVEVLRCLVSLGADVNTKNQFNTPLHEAVLRDPNVESVKFLISQGADVNAKDHDGKTPLDVANTEEKKAILRAAGGVSGQRGVRNSKGTL